MKNYIIIGALSALVLGSAGAMWLLNDNKAGEEGVSECEQICEHANSVCPSMLDKYACLSSCPDLSSVEKDTLAQANDCDALANEQDLLDEMDIPETKEAPAKPTSNDCEVACGNYLTLCLTLVPGAGPELFDDGYDSCLGECADWDSQKVECMINSFDCPAMTEVCGL